MTLFDFIIWSPNPEIFDLPFLPQATRWYGLLFAGAFLVGQQIMHYIYNKEGNDAKEVEKLTLYVIIATIVGARLGHCLFYDPIHYLSNPLKLLAIWEGGLASHGGAIGLFISLYLFSRKYKRKYLWVLDRVAIITLVTGAFIRFGNFVNSEIIGTPTDSDRGVVFAWVMEDIVHSADENIESVSFEKGGEISSEKEGQVPMTIVLEYKEGIELTPNQTKVFFESTMSRILTRYEHIKEHFYQDASKKIEYKTYKSGGVQKAEVYVLGIPRHPAQLYEAIACVIIFLIVAHIWFYHRDQVKDGLIFGVFMTLLWAERFTDEFFKENQELWENDIALNMGQWLSIPMFIFGVVVLIRSWGKREQTQEG